MSGHRNVCGCRHTWDQHELVEGIPQLGIPDVWVCSGGRLADVNAPDMSPWDFVCGCVLHTPPPKRPQCVT